MSKYTVLGPGGYPRPPWGDFTLKYPSVVVARKLRINGFYVDAKGGMHYTYIDTTTGESVETPDAR